MSAVITDVAGVCNLGLAKIGFSGRVGSLYDGTLAAKKCLDIYGQERDALLSSGEWDFCDRTIAGTLLKAAPASYIITPWTPAYPALPWLFEYAYPDDAVGIRTIRTQAILIPNFDPRYHRFSVSNDFNGASSAKTILCNVPNAIVVYAGQVTNPAEWTPTFLDALASRLGRVLAPVLRDLNAAKLAAAEEQSDMSVAAETRA